MTGTASERGTGGRSIRRQLLLGLLLPLLVIWLISAAVAYRMAFSFATEAYDRSLFDSALDLSRQLRSVNGRLQVEIPKVALDMLEYDEHDRVYYEIRGPRGEFLLGHRGLPEPTLATPRKPFYYYGNYRGDEIRIVAFHMPVSEHSDDEVALIQVAETLIKRQHLARDILLAVGLSQFVVIVLAFLSVLQAVGYGLTPLTALRDQILSRSHRDLSPIPDDQTPREVQPLVRAINELLARLSAALAAQQRFVADAAHQLRTPIAGLRTQTELALRQETLADVRLALDQLRTASDRGTHLVNQLLTLARAEPGASRVTPDTPVDLVQVARDTTMRWVPQALEKNIDLGFEAAGLEAATIMGNPTLLGEMIANLTDNAIRYTPRGGRVTVRVERQEHAIAVTVEDNGPGIPPEERELVFERFHRILGSGEEGCGLGLAIVREIADGHGATVELRGAARGTGTLVRVAFPSAPPGDGAGASTRQVDVPGAATGPAA